jgi:tetratricopeptide (TPR) repeat protein
MLMALVLGVAASAIQPVQHEPTASVEGSRNDRLGQIIDLIKAKKADEAGQIIDPLLDEYEHEHADEKRPIYCADDTTEADRYRRAETDARRPVLIIPAGWCTALWAKGYLLSDIGRGREAIPYLKRAAAMRPARPNYLTELAFAYQAVKDWPAMLDASTRLANLIVENNSASSVELCKAWHGMAYAQIELGKLDEATALLNKCLALDPANQKARNELDYIAKTRSKI